MNHSSIPRIAVLVDLPRGPQAGGHVKFWERIAAAAARSQLPFDLTVYFSGGEDSGKLAPHVRLRQLPPVFSTARLKFLQDIPDHTDLARHHARLAKELQDYDVLHATDGFFAFARTAESVSRRCHIPLITSFHTDTPSYARIFTRRLIERNCAAGWLRRALLDKWNVPERQQCRMIARLGRHLGHCRHALAARGEDRQLAEGILGAARVHRLRLGIDRTLFMPRRRDRSAFEAMYRIDPGSIILLFVGRLDIGKNIYVLIEAVEHLLRQGLPLHLIAAGQGPARDDIVRRLGRHASAPGFVPPEDLARLYTEADLLALPSEVEICSMAAVEALASGSPVFVTEKSGIAPIFDAAPAIKIVPDGVHGWVDALRLFAADPTQRDAMRKAAEQYGDARLASWSDVLEQDIFPVWQKAHAGKARKLCSAA